MIAQIFLTDNRKYFFFIYFIYGCRNKADKSASNSLYPSVLEGLAPLCAPDADCHRQSQFHMHLVASRPEGFLFHR